MADSAPGGGVHIHLWNGQHTQSLSRVQLGLQDYRICAINYIGKFDDEDKSRCIALELAVGDYGSDTVHSLHACRVSDIQEEAFLGDYIIP